MVDLVGDLTLRSTSNGMLTQWLYVSLLDWSGISFIKDLGS